LEITKHYIAQQLHFLSRTAAAYDQEIGIKQTSFGKIKIGPTRTLTFTRGKMADFFILRDDA